MAKKTSSQAPSQAPKTSAPTGITVTSVTPNTTTNTELYTGVTASGTRGGAKAIWVQVTFNGMSIGVEPAVISGTKWTCDVQGVYSPPGTLAVTATDDAGTASPGTMSLTV